MHAASTFTVSAFEPTDYVSPVATAAPVGHAHLTKEIVGDLTGRAHALFSAVYDQESGVGTYVALEAFEGSLHGREGSFAFAHSASTDGVAEQPVHEMFVIALGSGTRDLAGITGTGRLVVEADGTHRIELDYDLP